MKKNNRKLKGMSLYEMIIAIAIFAIMCAVLINVGVHIDRTTRATNKLKSKIVAEAPYAANHIKNVADPVAGTTAPLDTEPLAIEVKVTGAGTVVLKDALGSLYTSNYSNPEVQFSGVKYKTRTVYTQGMTPEEIAALNDLPNENHDIEFFEPETQTTTTAVVTTTT